jgi:hypothetical protein
VNEPPKIPMLRAHERLIERMMPDLALVAAQSSSPDLIDDVSDQILDIAKRSGLPSWVAAPALAESLRKLFSFSLERSRELRAEGLTNPADTPELT